jgi:hypothetical protein
VWRALSRSLDGLTRLGGTGGIVVLVVVVLAIVTRVPATRRGVAPVVALAVGAPAFLLLSATTHLPSFEELADRYLHVAELLMLPLVGVVLSRLLRRARLLVLAGVAVLTVLVVANGLALSDRVDGYTRINKILKPKVLAMAALPDLASFPPNAVLSEPLLFLVTAGGVERLKQDGAFPALPSLTSEQRAAVETDLGLRLEPVQRHKARPGSPSPAAVLSPLGGSVEATAPQCVTVDESSGPQPLAIKVGPPTSLPLSTTSSGQLVIRVPDSPSPGAALKLIDLEPGNYELHIGLRDTELHLELPGTGSTRLCGVTT